MVGMEWLFRGMDHQSVRRARKAPQDSKWQERNDMAMRKLDMTAHCKPWTGQEQNLGNCKLLLPREAQRVDMHFQDFVNNLDQSLSPEETAAIEENPKDILVDFSTNPEFYKSARANSVTLQCFSQNSKLYDYEARRVWTAKDTLKVHGWPENTRLVFFTDRKASALVGESYHMFDLACILYASYLNPRRRWWTTRPEKDGDPPIDVDQLIEAQCRFTKRRRRARSKVRDDGLGTQDLDFV